MRTSLEANIQSWPETWQAAYRVLEQSIAPNQLQAWIQPLQFLDVQRTETGARVRIVAPNDFSAQWVRDHHRLQIESAVAQVTGVSVELQLLVSDKPRQTQAPYEPPVEAARVSLTPTSAAPASIPSAYSPPYSGDTGPSAGLVIHSGNRNSRNEHLLDPRYTLESFVVGASNQFAYASAVAVAEQPGRQYNPLFLYSPPGLGKTHLLHAIGNHMLSKKPDARVAYLSAEQFVNELIDAIPRHKMPDFRAKYRDSYDLILIDDIQFIAGKQASEEEFFHTFNALYGSKRQIVLTSDRPPKEIEKLEERVRTRFEWGLIVDISVPEIETRIAILKAKAERDDIYLPDDVATFLATYIKSNVRELEGVLIKLQAQSSLTGAEISIEMAKHELRFALPEEGSHLTAESILAAVAKHFRLKTQDFKSVSRTRKLAGPRQVAMYLIRKYTSMGYKEIGVYFGGKDHSTIMHACRKIEAELETDPATRDTVEAIQNLL